MGEARRRGHVDLFGVAQAVDQQIRADVPCNGDKGLQTRREVRLTHAEIFRLHRNGAKAAVSNLSGLTRATTPMQSERT